MSYQRRGAFIKEGKRGGIASNTENRQSPCLCERVCARVRICQKHPSGSSAPVQLQDQDTAQHVTASNNNFFPGSHWLNRLAGAAVTLQQSQQRGEEVLECPGQHLGVKPNPVGANQGIPLSSPCTFKALFIINGLSLPGNHWG
eukprot:1152332-Pelagomonas_calceolata.AAC.2